MNDRPHDELLSAYLDGEATAEEQARAERLLAEDRRAGRLFDELRLLRTCLQELPRQNLPEDFSARVLRSAERQMLQSPPAALSKPGDTLQLSWQERIRRPLAYASLVLAASVLIMIFSPEKAGQEAPDGVAHRARPTPTLLPREEAARQAEPPAMAAAAPPADFDTLPAGEPERPALGKSPASKKEAVFATEGFGNAEGLVQPAPHNKAGEAVADRSSLLVVTCEITPAAARQDAFRQLLTRNSIDLDEAAPAAPAQTPPPPLLENAKGLGVDAAKTGLEVVYVEASAEQLENTLADMASQPKDFLSVEVGAAEHQSVQNRWQDKYSRGHSGLVQQRSLENNFVAPGPKPAGPAQTGEERGKNKASTAQPANSAQHLAGRARGYFMPAEGLNYQPQAAGQATLQQQPPSAPGGAPAAASQVQKRIDDAQRSPAPSRAAAAQNAAAEPANLRALFVLRVAKDQPAEPAAPAKPTDK